LELGGGLKSSSSESSREMTLEELANLFAPLRVERELVGVVFFEEVVRCDDL
jgi:hypothetical protein